jgi:flagellin
MANLPLKPRSFSARRCPRDLQESNINVSAAPSRTMDADYAAETTDLVKNQILQQASTAMLAQAKAIPNIALQLLRS